MFYFSKLTKGFYSPQEHNSYFLEHTVNGEDGSESLEYTPDPNGPIADAVKITPEEREALLYAERQGKVIAFDEETQKPIAIDRVFTPEEIISQYTAAIQARLDDFARTRGYDSCLSACTYATSQVTKFAAEGQYMVNARDATWAAAYEIMADVQAGTRPMPTLEDLIAELGALTWPA